MDKNKIIGIISTITFILGWIAYAKINIVLAILLEIIALILGFYSNKKSKNVFAKIGGYGATVLLAIMIIILISTGISSNSGDQALINKAKEIEKSQSLYNK